VITGVIEGFYGAPWSLADRKACIELLARFDANAYVWAGKSEPRHRDLWRDDFMPEELDGFAELAGHRGGVRLIVGLTPGSDATTSEVVHKLRPAIASGAHGVALLFDDLPVLDAAERHRTLANEIEQTFACPVWVTPTHYAGLEGSPYLNELLSGLSSSVEVMWTGEHVVSDRIDASHARARALACAGRAPLLWDNTPVNDALMTEALHLGPYAGRDPELRHVVSGVLVNPMMFARASLPTIASAMEWCRGGDAMATWESCIDERGWRRLAEATAFPDDPHWPGARPSRQWWEEVAAIEVDDIDEGCGAWVSAAREGARLAIGAIDLIERPDPDPQLRTMATIGLAMSWRTWHRQPVLTFGSGPRLRPVLTNDDHGRFTYDGRSISYSSSLVDDLVKRATN
jgi:hypothetical protein